MKAKFNLIDAVVILLIVAIGAAGYLFLSNRSEAVSSDKKVKIFYEVTLTKKDEYMTTIFEEGSKAFVGEKEKIPATVVGCEVTPAQDSSFDGESGKFINAEIPEKYDIVVKLMSEGTDNAGSVSVNGTAIRVGSQTSVKGREFAGYGYITRVYTEE